MLKKRRMLLSLGAASLATGPLALTSGIRPARAPRIIVEIFLIFRGRQIVKFASEQAVCVLELTLSCSLTFML